MDVHNLWSKWGAMSQKCTGIMSEKWWNNSMPDPKYQSLTHIAGQLKRSLVQAPAQSRVNSEIRPGLDLPSKDGDYKSPLGTLLQPWTVHLGKKFFVLSSCIYLLFFFSNYVYCSLTTKWIFNVYFLNSAWLPLTQMPIPDSTGTHIYSPSKRSLILLKF